MPATKPQRRTKSIDESIRLSDLNTELASGELRISDNGIILFEYKFEMTGEKKRKEFDLSEVILPPNELFSEPMPLSKRKDLVITLLFAVDAYLRRSKRTHTKLDKVTQVIKVICLFYEALWIRNIIATGSMSRQQFSEIASEYSVGGWPSVLRISARAAREKIGLSELAKKGAKASVLRRLGTNYTFAGSYLRSKLAAEGSPETGGKIDGSISTEESERPPDTERYTARSIRHNLAIANLLFDAKQGFGLVFLPFPNPHELANLLGRPCDRTKNVLVKSAGRILKTTMLYLYEIFPLLRRLLEEMIVAAEAASACGRRQLGEYMYDAFRSSSIRKDLNELLPYSIEFLDTERSPSGEIAHTVRSVILNVIASCFILISIMNARRKCEISDSDVGLYSGCLVTVNADLGLYQVPFYIAKTFCKRIPFYVNATTVDAINALEAFQYMYARFERCAIHEKTSTTNGKTSLFTYRRLNARYGIGIASQFEFAEYKDSAGVLGVCHEALGDGNDWSASHIGRRMYGIVFFYRYENSDLIALKYQYGQIDLETTRAYVTDPLSRHDMESIYFTSPTEAEEHKRARMQEIADLDRELGIVGDEKLAEEIYAILEGKSFSGGYAFYVKKVYAKFARTASFSGTRGVDAVISAMKRKGHFPRPFPHGECMLGTALNQRAARCYSGKSKRVEREKASVKICSGCIYHLSKAAYIENLKADRVFLVNKLSAGKDCTLENVRNVRELEELDEAIVLLRSRLGV
ncbi:hypothetical protein KZJ38_21585 [Paraburkholderia edwinii]|uniref:Uncharacterized protein n=1 Tax=Paraburkholderia edwinii TaxID=2861782 RepID=A0ABX8UJM8_9BURK|nr:hypothetical protein [Paraburkholderia edwinii]QYD68776.1 hypothetical protein KZJ38_21585 [Paraburkholderia edwinii]